MTTIRNDTLDDFLAVRGLSSEWLIEQCEDLQTDPVAANTVLEILAALVRSGIALPPVAASMVSAVLLDLAIGKDARYLVGTAPTRGRPASDYVMDRRIEAGACLALMKLNEFERNISVRLVASAMGLNETDVEKIDLPEMVGDYNHQAHLVEEGADVLWQVLNARISDPELADWRAKLADICSVTNSR